MLVRSERSHAPENGRTILWRFRRTTRGKPELHPGRGHPHRPEGLGVSAAERRRVRYARDRGRAGVLRRDRRNLDCPGFEDGHSDLAFRNRPGLEGFAHDLYGRRQAVRRACGRGRDLRLRPRKLERRAEATLGIMIMLKRILIVLGLIGGGALCRAQNLEIYWVDAEGGAATLIVAPGGESLLVDTGNSGPDDRDAKRIFAATQKAGLKKIDILLTTHFHRDHTGGMAALAKMIPIEMFMDHGPSAELSRPRVAQEDKAYEDLASGKRRILKPGDSIPPKGVN